MGWNEGRLQCEMGGERDHVTVGKRARKMIKKEEQGTRSRLRLQWGIMKP